MQKVNKCNNVLRKLIMPWALATTEDPATDPGGNSKLSATSVL